MVTWWSVDKACGCVWRVWEDHDFTTWVQHSDNPEHRRQFPCRMLVRADDEWEPVREWITEVNNRCLVAKAV